MNSDQPLHPDLPASQSTDGAPMPEHHGDLRKRAYLRRRADYQLQASTGVTLQQAGMIGGYGRRAQS